ncbi:phasin family protein [Paraburkholderia franconis]|uniref:phasin family protein n=1 Tax=Paraburkholderia franconis TaxID=2654983 RepID=UPI0038994C7A
MLNNSFAGVEKLASLNLQVFKSTLPENQEIAARALSAKDPQELFALQASQAQPTAGKVQSYLRHIYKIMSGTQAEFTMAFKAQANGTRTMRGPLSTTSGSTHRPEAKRP